MIAGTCPRCASVTWCNCDSEITGLRADLAAHRRFIEAITQDGTEYGDEWETLIDCGLVVEVPSTQEFRDEWGDDEELMWVLAWSPLADCTDSRRALGVAGEE